MVYELCMFHFYHKLPRSFSILWVLELSLPALLLTSFTFHPVFIHFQMDKKTKYILASKGSVLFTGFQIQEQGTAKYPEYPRMVVV